MKEIKIVNCSTQEQEWFGSEVLLEANGWFPFAALCAVGDDGKYKSTRGVAVRIGGNLGCRSVGVSKAEVERAVELLKEAGHAIK